jgi:hypothetical protein
MFHTSSDLLSPEERALLEELPQLTEPDALIAVNPSTGAALAYALANRRVTEPHIYATPTEDQLFLAANLNRIDSDPLVCPAVVRAGVDYVLDFGTRAVYPPAVPHDYSGYANLVPGAHLELVASNGPEVSLFRIVGC